jgi:hypothetical protein
MNVRYLILGVLASLLCSGCHRQARNDTYVELMGAQRRALEDRIYDLQFEMEDLTAELEKIQTENQQLKQQLDGPDSDLLINPGRPGDDAPGDQTPLPGIPRIKIDPGTPTEKPAPKDPPADGNDKDFELLPAPRGDSTSQPTSGTGPLSHIVLDPEKTSMTGFDGRTTNDGVMLSMQTRDQQDRYVEQPGAMSIVVLDPLQTGQAARVARWDITQADVQRMLTSTTGIPGIRLELEWPDNPPRNPELMLFVRYETADGRKFETHTRITHKASGNISQDRPTLDFPVDPPSEPSFQVDPDAQTSKPISPPASILHIPSAARSATAQPAAGNSQRLQWRPYR